MIHIFIFTPLFEILLGVTQLNFNIPIFIEADFALNKSAYVKSGNLKKQLHNSNLTHSLKQENLCYLLYRPFFQAEIPDCQQDLMKREVFSISRYG